MRSMRDDKETGTILLAVLLGFAVGSGPSLLLASASVFAFSLVNWIFFADGAASGRQWWLLRVIVPGALLVFLLRSYLALSA